MIYVPATSLSLARRPSDLVSAYNFSPINTKEIPIAIVSDY